MRTGAGQAVLCLALLFAAGADAASLPAYFKQSWDMVVDHPMMVVPPRLSDAPAKPADPPAASTPASTPVAADPAPTSAEQDVAEPDLDKGLAQPQDVAVPKPRPAVRKPVATAADVPARPKPAIDPPAAEATPSGAGTPTAVVLKVPAAVRIRDPSSFAIGGDVYKFASTEGLGLNTRCTPEGGKCIYHPMKALKTAIAGATLRCQRQGAGSVSVLSGCSKGGN